MMREDLLRDRVRRLVPSPSESEVTAELTRVRERAARSSRLRMGLTGGVAAALLLVIVALALAEGDDSQDVSVRLGERCDPAMEELAGALLEEAGARSVRPRGAEAPRCVMQIESVVGERLTVVVADIGTVGVVELLKHAEPHDIEVRNSVRVLAAGVYRGPGPHEVAFGCAGLVFNLIGDEETTTGGIFAQLDSLTSTSSCQGPHG